MKKSILFLLFTAVTSVYAVECKVSITPGEPEKVTLNNGLLKFTFIPEFKGSICAWEYVPQKRSLIRPLKYQVDRVDLLPAQIIASPDGFRCLIKGVNAKIINKLRVKSLTSSSVKGCQLTMEAARFGGVQLALNKQMRLLPESTVLEGTVRITNNQKISGNYFFWFNCLIFSDKLEPVLVPARANLKRINGMGITQIDKDGVVEELYDGNRNMYFAALRPWVAKAVPSQPGTAVLRIEDPEPEKLMHYTHKSGEAHTIEIISSPVKLAAGKSAFRNFQLMYFPSLKAVRDVFGFYGVDLENDTLIIESAVPAGKTEWLINGKKHQIPALKPGRFHTIESVASPGKSVKISIDGKEYVLPQRSRII